MSKFLDFVLKADNGKRKTLSGKNAENDSEQDTWPGLLNGNQDWNLDAECVSHGMFTESNSSYLSGF